MYYAETNTLHHESLHKNEFFVLENTWRRYEKCILLGAAYFFELFFFT